MLLLHLPAFQLMVHLLIKSRCYLIHILQTAIIRKLRLLLRLLHATLLILSTHLHTSLNIDSSVSSAAVGLQLLGQLGSYVQLLIYFPAAATLQPRHPRPHRKPSPAQTALFGYFLISSLFSANGHVSGFFIFHNKNKIKMAKHIAKHRKYSYLFR